MSMDQIEIHVAQPAFNYRPLRKLEVRSEAMTVFSRTPTEDDVNAKLRTLAAQVGGNAVVDVVYSRGISLTSWKALKATGVAVLKETAANDGACAACNAPNDAGARFCTNCGAAIGAVSVGQATDIVSDGTLKMPFFADNKARLIWAGVSMVAALIIAVVMATMGNV